jgi:hypothetical protein
MPRTVSLKPQSPDFPVPITPPSLSPPPLHEAAAGYDPSEEGPSGRDPSEEGPCILRPSAPSRTCVVMVLLQVYWMRTTWAPFLPGTEFRDGSLLRSERSDTSLRNREVSPLSIDTSLCSLVFTFPIEAESKGVDARRSSRSSSHASSADFSPLPTLSGLHSTAMMR